MGYYYKCAADSPTGARLKSFAEEAVSADDAAEAYAAKYGAVSYVQPAQYFAGGVDFLEFAEAPDPGVWRKLENINVDVYEPNCMTNLDVAVLNTDEGIGSLPCGSPILSGVLTLEEAFPLFPPQIWAKKIGYKLTGEKRRDLNKLKERLKGKKFCLVANLEKPASSSPEQFKEAVEAECVRLRLPVVDVRLLVDVLGCWPDRRVVAMDVTPTFFNAGSTFYVHCKLKCSSPDLEVISEAEYKSKEKMVEVD